MKLLISVCEFSTLVCKTCIIFYRL